MRRDHPRDGRQRRGMSAYTEPKIPPEEHYVGYCDDTPIKWPWVPCGVRTCCCCFNAGMFESISHREEPVNFRGSSCRRCCSRRRKEVSATGEPPASGCCGAPLGRKGCGVCMWMAIIPITLPIRAWVQRRRILNLYPVESTLTQVRRPCRPLARVAMPQSVFWDV